MNRLIAAILILALLACPLWCGVGQSLNIGFSSIQKSSATESPSQQHRCACCCHRNETQQDKSSDRDPCSPDPENSACQGICGGAILEQPTSLTTADLTFDHLPFVAAIIFETDRSARGISFVLSERHSGGPLHGRQLRIAHQSFLC